MKFIKLYLSTCGHCMALGKILEENFSQIDVEAIEVSDRAFQTEMIKKYNLIDVPTLILVQDNNNELGRLHGIITKEQIDELISKHK